jgi:hypothetical protein
MQQINELIMNHPNDHIMANTWRLIFEHTARIPTQATASKSDFNILEQLLPEYRLIGLSLADERSKRCRN